jgi:hypothetical protein
MRTDSAIVTAALITRLYLGVTGYADSAAAFAGGVQSGQVYRIGGTLIMY